MNTPRRVGPGRMIAPRRTGRPSLCSVSPPVRSQVGWETVPASRGCHRRQIPLDRRLGRNHDRQEPGRSTLRGLPMLPLTVPTAESGEGCATCRSHPLPEGQAERPPVIRRPSMSLAVRRRSSSPRTYPVHGVHRGLPGYRGPELFARRRDGAPDRTLGLIVAPPVVGFVTWATAPAVDSAVGGLLRWLAFGAAYGAVTGTTLLWLLRRRLELAMP